MCVGGIGGGGGEVILKVRWYFMLGGLIVGLVLLLTL